MSLYRQQALIEATIRRAKIEDRHTPFIETVRNVGYRFRTG